MVSSRSGLVETSATGHVDQFLNAFDIFNRLRGKLATNCALRRWIRLHPGISS